jgi:hypothetical protein
VGALGKPPGSHFTTNIFFAELTSYRHGRKGARHQRLQIRWRLPPDLPLAPPGASASTSPTLVVAAAGPATSTPRGSAIDVSNSGGGRCRTYRQHPSGGPPSMSPTLVVVAAGSADRRNSFSRLYHILKNHLKPYNDLLSLTQYMLRHTLVFDTDSPSETFMYMSESSYSYKYAVTTSINCKDRQF